jgi:hypothetical protein
MFTLHGGLPGAGFGSTVASAGDVDVDSVPDLLCGAWNWSPFPDAGEVHVFSGRNGLILQHLQGSAGDERLGAALAGLGDLDDDGYGDFAVGAPGNWPPGKAGAVHIVRPRFTLASCGAGLAGARGVPVLQAKGLLTPGKPFTLSLSNAVPNGSALLVVGLSAIHHAFKGGTMVPAVNLLLPGWMTDPAGELQLMTAWPGGLPSATALYLQFWLPDAAGVQGFSASNGVHALTP